MKKVKFFSDFKAFISKGNILDMAVGVIIGGAFGKIVSSLVADVIMPIISLFVGNIDLKDLAITLKDKTETSAGIELHYGMFLQNLLDFVIVAFAIFIFIKVIIKLKSKLISEEKVEEATPAVPEDVKLLTEIRDLLKNK